jgi:hypothetical protein
MGFWRIYIVRYWEKSKNKVILSAIHHRQNPLESKLKDVKRKDSYEAERIRKEAAALYVKIQFPYFPTDSEEKNEKSIGRVSRRFEVLIQGLRNTKQPLHRDVLF